MLIIYDLDGTLLSVMPAYARLFAEIIAKYHDSRAIPDKQTLITHLRQPDIAGASAYHKLARLDHKLGTRLSEKSDSIVAELRQRKSEIYKSDSVFGGVADICARLLDRGHHLAVASSADPDNVVRAITVSGLDHIFGPNLYGCTPDMATKPDPAVLLRASGEHDIEAAHSVYVGDSIDDMEAAQAAGFHAVGFAGGGVDPAASESALYAAGAHHVIHTHDALVDIIDTISAKAPLASHR